MHKRHAMLTLVAITVVAVLVPSGTEAGFLTDGSLDPFNKNNSLPGYIPTPFHMPGSVPPSVSTFDDPIVASIDVVNDTQSWIAYSINGFAKPRIQPGGRFRWSLQGSTDNPPVFNVSFDNGHNKTISYRLLNNSVNHFRFAPAGLDLFRD